MDALSVGFVIVAADVLVWRFRLPTNDVGRLLIRIALFVGLSSVLFRAGLSPFSQAQSGVGTPAFRLAQLLEIIWWLNGARLLSLALDTLLLPGKWRRQRLFQDVFGAVVFLAAFVSAMGFVLDLPVRGLVATSGVLAVVLGLAIQSTLSDVFAGIVLNTTEPYQIGDHVLIDDVEGKVVDMNWRATHLLTGQGNVVIVPNSAASKAKITNQDRPPALHAVTLVLSISPAARPKTVLDALNLALESCVGLLDSPSPSVSLKQALPAAVQYELVAYVNAIDRKSAVLNQLHDLAFRHLVALGIDLSPPGVAPVEPDRRSSLECLLRRVELFATLADKDIQEFAARMSVRECKPGEEVVSPQTVPDSLNVVQRGVLSVYVGEAASRSEIARMAPGDAFGETGLLAGLPAEVHIVARTPVVLYQLKKSDFTPFVKDKPAVAMQMCLLLTQRMDSIGKVAIQPPQDNSNKDNPVFEWLWDKVTKLHALYL